MSLPRDGPLTKTLLGVLSRHKIFPICGNEMRVRKNENIKISYQAHVCIRHGGFNNYS